MTTPFNYRYLRCCTYKYDDEKRSEKIHIYCTLETIEIHCCCRCIASCPFCIGYWAVVLAVEVGSWLWMVALSWPRGATVYVNAERGANASPLILTSLPATWFQLTHAWWRKRPPLRGRPRWEYIPLPLFLMWKSVNIAGLRRCNVGKWNLSQKIISRHVFKLLTSLCWCF